MQWSFQWVWCQEAVLLHAWCRFSRILFPCNTHCVDASAHACASHTRAAGNIQKSARRLCPQQPWWETAMNTTADQACVGGRAVAGGAHE